MAGTSAAMTDRVQRVWEISDEQARVPRVRYEPGDFLAMSNPSPPIFESLIAHGYQVEFHSHATAILLVDFPEAVAELENALLGVTIPIEEIIAGGGGEAK